jgi:hypothetical protein
MKRQVNGFFWLSVAMFLFMAGGTVYCAVDGVVCWPGVVMMLYWLILAWGHAHDA